MLTCPSDEPGVAIADFVVHPRVPAPLALSLEGEMLYFIQRHDLLLEVRLSPIAFFTNAQPQLLPPRQWQGEATARSSAYIGVD